MAAFRLMPTHSGAIFAVPFPFMTCNRSVTESLSPPDATMDQHRDGFTDAARLRERVQEVGAQFLLTEVQAGLALMDVADTSASDDANAHRRALAREAYDVVSDRLSRTGHGAVVLSPEEREEITRLRAELGARLGLREA